MRLPAGNQVDVLATLHRDELTAAELDGVVDLVLAARGQSQEAYILDQPRPRCSKRGSRRDGPGTLDSASLAIALRDALLVCLTAWAAWRSGCTVKAALV